MESLKIVALTIVAAVIYGILQDQVTARVCVEYFTVAHPRVFDTDNPTALAFGWGVIATWWVGVLLGVPLTLVARLGRRPKLTARDLVRPLLVSMGCIAVIAFIAGLVGFGSSRDGVNLLPAPVVEKIPPEKVPLLLADAWAHSAAYGGGFVAGLVLWVWTWRRRGRLQRESDATARTGTAINSASADG
jgi:hypothetical protein